MVPKMVPGDFLPQKLLVNQNKIPGAYYLIKHIHPLTTFTSKLFMQHRHIYRYAYKVYTLRGEIFRFKNLKFKIWSNDHAPPHVHVSGLDAHAKINLETLEIMKASGFSEKDLKIIQQQIFKRKIKILEKWEEIHGKN